MSHLRDHSMYYIAIVCPMELDKKISEFKYRMRDHFGCTAALKSPAHITLIPPFWLHQAKETELLQTVQSFTSSRDTIEVQLDGFSHFGKRVLFVHVKENPSLAELHREIQDHFLVSLGDVIKPGNRPFHPHITIATRDLKPSAFFKSWEYFSKKEFKESFITKKISLLKLSPGKWDVISEKTW